jgi:hypothetical protein
MRLDHGKYGLFYRCTRAPECDGMMSAHRDGTPTGTPAGVATRALRRKLHAVFDEQWVHVVNMRKRKARRERSYRRLARMMGLPREEAHIGMFDEKQCLRALALLGREE